MLNNKNIDPIYSETLDQYLPRLKNISREFLWIGLGHGIAAIGGVVGVRLLTNVLNPDAYGEIALGMTGATLAHQIILGPLTQAFTRFFAPAKEKGQLKAYLRGVWLLLNRALFLLSGLMLILVLGLWLFDLNNWLLMIIGVFFLSLLLGYNSALNGIQNAARQRIVVAWHQGFRQWARFAVALGMIAIFGATSEVVIWGYATATLIVMVSQFWFFQKKILKDISIFMIMRAESGNWAGELFKYAWPFITWGIFTWAQLSSDRWALQIFGTTQDVGLYTVLYQLGFYPISLIATLLVQLISPILFTRAGDGSDQKRLNRTHQVNIYLVLGTIIMTFVAAIVAFFFHEWIFSLFAATEYQIVSSMLPWMVLAGGVFAAGQIASISYLSDINSKKLILPKIITAILGVGMNFGGAYLFSLPGVVISRLIFSVIYFFWVLLYLLFRADVLQTQKK